MPGRSFFSFQPTISRAASAEPGSASKSTGRMRAQESGNRTEARVRRP
jgi:hypothetical protein